MTYVGHCLCGKTTVTVKTEQPVQVACHCTDCQRASGSTYSVNITPKVEDVIFEGPVKQYVSKGSSGSDVTRKFCGECGSSLSHHSPALGGLICVHTGIFPETFKTVPFAAEIFIKDKFTGLPPIPSTGQFETVPPQ